MKIVNTLFFIYIFYLIVSFFLPNKGINYIESKSSFFYEKYDFKPIFGIANKIKKLSNINATINDLKLKAVFIAGDQSFISVEKNGKTIFINLNSTYNGYKLIKILSNEAIFEKNGKKYKITMEKPLKNYTYELPSPTSQNSFEISKSTLREYTTNFNKIWSNIGIRPYFKNGKLNGYEITYIKPYSIFEQIGLKKGDVIKAVNNHPLKSNADAFNIYKNILKQDNLKITILRNGLLKELEYEIKG